MEIWALRWGFEYPVGTVLYCTCLKTLPVYDFQSESQTGTIEEKGVLVPVLRVCMM